eukprot:CAMPEP_0184683096 /NCGR_PEP_ID=MMETSP0312-20130426/9958_1 /TAXON_ID=31354 /ORGANISM="Compsopogon coeruleus, Strain SAG 36.94" /LENGTH=544 /DNA_ID=CAMNT_0027135181 /DNA_START=12 /DNA_END=1643 /DNA_ORIENTATION=+
MKSAKEVRICEDEIQSNVSSSIHRVLELLEVLEGRVRDDTEHTVDVVVAALHAARRVLCLDILRKAAGSSVDGEDEGVVELNRWLRKRRTQLYRILAQLVVDQDLKVRMAALSAGAVMGARGDEWSASFGRCVEVVLMCKDAMGLEMREMLGQSLLRRFDDVRTEALRAMTKVLDRNTVSDEIVPRVLDLLRYIGEGMPPTVQQEPSRVTDGASSDEQKRKRGLEENPPVSVSEEGRALFKSERRAFNDCWLAVLRCTLSPDQKAEILRRVSGEIIPRMSHPLRLADALTEAFSEVDAASAILALEGLFDLIIHHNLDYPCFYPKLYTLLTPDALYSESRDKFKSLIPKFVLSKFLPGSMACAFVKRLVRRALLVPPVEALWCMRLALDLMRSHPMCHILVHRERQQGSFSFFDAEEGSLPTAMSTLTTTAVQARIGADPYDDDEPDPVRSNASHSSLWELNILRTHFCPSVSRFVSAFNQDIRRRGTAQLPPPPPGSHADYVDMSYQDLFQMEIKRKSKECPLQYSSVVSVSEVSLGGSVVVW